MQSMIEHLAFDIQTQTVSIIKYDQAEHLLHYYNSTILDAEVYH